MMMFCIRTQYVGPRIVAFDPNELRSGNPKRACTAIQSVESRSGQ